MRNNDYDLLYQAYDHFNRDLFGGRLPDCLLSIRCTGERTLGYYWPEKFSSRTGANRSDEIALNPEAFPRRTDRDILSTLVHEMCHLWQHKVGKPSRNNYHNREWANRMIEIGLVPSDTGEPGGRQVGQQMTHYIADKGPFAVSFAQLEATGFQLRWQTFPGIRAETARPSKVKYTCPGCNQRAWAKPDSNLVCGDCMETMSADDDGA